ncbi:MAG: SCP2 sterol-binding domain-containing protein [Pseudomonadota bacterium]
MASNTQRSPDPLAGLTQVLADMATAISQQALASDPAMGDRLAALEGKRIAIIARPMGSEWHLSFVDATMQVSASSEQPPHVKVEGSPMTILGWLVPALGSDAMADLTITGDATILVELNNILADFKPDIGAPLESLFGSQASATLLGTAEMGLRGFQSLLQGVHAAAQKQTADTFVNEQQMDKLLNGIDDLRLRVDRLAARLQEEERKR